MLACPRQAVVQKAIKCGPKESAGNPYHTGWGEALSEPAQLTMGLQSGLHKRTVQLPRPQ